MQPDQKSDPSQNAPTQEPSDSESLKDTPNTPQANTFSASPMPGMQPDTNYAALPQPNKTNGMAIAGLVLAFIIPLLGFILSIISLGQIKKRGEGGRGLAIAGIVISSLFMIFTVFAFLSILLAVPKMQQNARNTQAQVEVSSLHAQLEAFYDANKFYPASLEELKVSNPEDLSPPSQSSSTYNYEPGPDGCVQCKTYTLSTVLEDGTTYSKSSLN